MGLTLAEANRMVQRAISKADELGVKVSIAVCDAGGGAGAERAARPVPPLVAHLPVCVHDDAKEAREAVRQQFAGFARSPFYQNMFIAAGFPEVSQGTWSDAMVDAKQSIGKPWKDGGTLT